ncbi:hypothetical protein [Streptomyces sp. NPDC050856]|uniref:hypothetical protein n=1 Tax=Streptomyces sp. NPDC050856 TaxID=3154939 RepID=UPI0033CE0B66
MVPAGRPGAVTTPALVVDGGASPVGTRDAARAVAGALPRGRHSTLTGQSHPVAPHVPAPVLEEFFGGWDAVGPSGQAVAVVAAVARRVVVAMVAEPTTRVPS